MSDGLADGEGACIHRVPIAVGDEGEVVGAECVGDIHEGDCVAVDFVTVVFRVADAAENQKQRVEECKFPEARRIHSQGTLRIVSYAATRKTKEKTVRELAQLILLIRWSIE